MSQNKRRIVASQSVIIRNKDSNYETQNDLVMTPQCNKKPKVKQSEIENYDDTGYKALQLEGDTFLEKINIVK